MKVFFLGAGPGDPRLLTVKARDVIRRADIIIYAGSLVNKEMIKMAKAKARVHDSSAMSLGQILKVMKAGVSHGHVIARVHSGDPSLYGAIQEQIDWCEKEKIPCEVIPGVSSFCAGAASLKQELTSPGVSQTVIITRLSGRTKVPSGEALNKLARIRATMVIFLSVDRIDKVVQELLSGYKPDTPAAIVFRASWPDQKIIKGTLKDISSRVKREGIGRQALIYVGDALKRECLEKSRLYDENFSHSYREKR